MNKLNFYSDALALECQGLLNLDTIDGWERRYLEMLISGQAIADHGLAVFIMEQYWAAAGGSFMTDPVVVHLDKTARLSGIPNYPVWPVWLPEQILITLDSDWSVGGYRLPSIFVSRYCTTNDAYRQSTHWLMDQQGLANDTISVPDAKENHWLVTFQEPHSESMQSGWQVTRITGKHIDAILASHDYRDYAAILNELAIDDGTRSNINNSMLFDVHRLVVAIIHHINTTPQRAGDMINMTIGGRAINAYQITISDRASPHES